VLADLDADSTAPRNNERDGSRCHSGEGCPTGNIQYSPIHSLAHNFAIS
jgi:hypothetical protein